LWRLDGDAESAGLKFARVKFAAQTRSKMQGWKMRDWKIEHKKFKAGKCGKNKLPVWLMYTVS